MRRIGFIGMGTMGAPMALNLLKAGFEVTVYNRSLDRLAGLYDQGLMVADSLSEAVVGKDAVITMLSNDAAVKQVVTGDNGIMDYIEAPTVLVDMSTVSPDTSASISEVAKEMGITMIDAPVSGSSNAAQSGSLVILGGGNKEVYDSLKDVFAAMGKASYYFGESGSGSKAKLVINLMLGITMQGISEALVLAEKFFLDRATVLDMMQQAAVASPFLAFKKDLLLKEDFPVAFALKHMHKDLGLILEQARDNGSVLPATSAAYQSYSAAMNHQKEDVDMAAVFAELLQQSGVTKE
ncbi:NAD(P)-dependent oxidoreductase [Aneurinibacillus sp. Ricciae_BoGa-3]|uniref:NAD(P)-dependent oxidoreductase n=1 Tax=Aneurinibacillus sp. Ricciae_BoGa-3 TaxID=3022697 RepID=UPI00234055C3|nr:NAD(P)-dependent oxidoreductase [Aneurinibacillus sp. Ricciae_BoGa-3]WCK55699.1 NAD(P)-dependent oxidoreductase [Aneurinibacillus sp. Ricciae_BoGa-3]